MKQNHGPWAYPPARRVRDTRRFAWTFVKLVAAILAGLIVAAIATEAMATLAAAQIGGTHG
jgi:hypothetical protein